MTFWIGDWLQAFGLTVFVECLIAFPLLRRSEPSILRRLAAVLLVNLATHPLVWFLFPGLLMPYGARVALSEIWAVVGEACAYAVIWPAAGLKRAALVSFAANAASFLLGLFVLSGRTA
jgi:hypothetical protein